MILHRKQEVDEFALQSCSAFGERLPIESNEVKDDFLAVKRKEEGKGQVDEKIPGMKLQTK